MLPFLDAEQLKEIGVNTIGQRLAILKAVYHLKLQYNIPIEADHYVPPCSLDFILFMAQVLTPVQPNLMTVQDLCHWSV